MSGHPFAHMDTNSLHEQTVPVAFHREAETIYAHVLIPETARRGERQEMPRASSQILLILGACT